MGSQPNSIDDKLKENQIVADVSLFFGLLAVFFVAFPGAVMFWRLFTRPREGLSAMWSPPYDIDPAKRRLSSRIRNYLYQRTSHGFKLDLMQAFLSLLSCGLFIAVSYLQSEPIWITDLEDAITTYFLIDYGLRLWLAQDTLKFFFSLTALLDFVTVVPALVVWLIQAGGDYQVDVSIIIASIRAFRVFRMFRVLRVIRLLSLSPSYAFQRQIFVLSMTVLSLIFVAAGLYQITEGGQVKTFPFHKAIYYATITVVGRPGVPVDGIWTAAFLTITVLLAVTVIPTFVAELIRLWYDQSTLETYKGNPETPHVIICGDTNVSRLRALAQQYFHRSRDPDSQTPIVILAEAKPEGALKHFIESYRFSGLVRYIRGSARRAADLRRVDIGKAKGCIVLNYRSDKEANAADTEVLSTVMAIKQVSPQMRVLAQLYKPRKRNHLKAVPGWQDGDKSISAVALGMTMMGLSTRIPGFSTLVTNLVRRGQMLAGLPDHSLKGKALPWWHLMLYGDAAKSAAMATLHSAPGSSGQDGAGNPEGGGGSSLIATTDAASGTAIQVRVDNRTPLEEYALSIDSAVHEMPINPLLEGRTFGATARMAYLRFGITLIGATLPVNDDVFSLVSGLPKTYRLVLFPSEAVLRKGMKLYGIAANPTMIEKFRVETGGEVKTALAQVVDTVSSAFVFGNSAAPTTASGLSTGAAFGIGGFGLGSGGKKSSNGAVELQDGSDGTPGVDSHETAGGSSRWNATGAAHSHGDHGHSHGGGAGAPSSSSSSSFSHPTIANAYPHNSAASSDLSLPWCFCELEDLHEQQQALVRKLHLEGVQHGMQAAIPVFNRTGNRTANHNCPVCNGAQPTRPHPLSLLQGQGICVVGSLTEGESMAVVGLGSSASAPSGPKITVSSDDFSFEKLEAKTPAAVAAADADSKKKKEETSGGNGGGVAVASAAAAAEDANPSPASASSAASGSEASLSAPAATSSPSTSSTASAASAAPATTTAETSIVPASASAQALKQLTASAPPRTTIPRRTSLGDDGLGAIDDTEDIQGPRGPLLTQAPSVNSNLGINVTARLAARANTNSLAVRLALPVTAVTDVESMAADALDSIAAAKYKGHVLVCGASDGLGYLLRAIASLASPRTGVSTLDYGISSTSAAGGVQQEEGDQYNLKAEDIVVLAMSKPADAAINAFYPGASRLLSRVTFIQGNPAEAADLLKAGVQTARAAIILTGSKPSVSADGGDNLTDDCDAIVTASIINKLAPGLPLMTEILHGGHAPHLRPQGNGLNDAQRGALIAVLEERESSRQRARLENAIRQVAAEREIRTAGTGSAALAASSRAAGSAAGGLHIVAPGVVHLPPGITRTDILLSKLNKQRMRLRAAMTGSLVFSKQPSLGGGITPALLPPPGIRAGPVATGSSAGGAAGSSSNGGGNSSDGSFWSSELASSAVAGGGGPHATAAYSLRSSRAETAPVSSAPSTARGGLSAAVDALDQARALGSPTSRGPAGGASSIGTLGGGGAGANFSDSELEQLAETGLSNTAIVDVLVGVREDFSATTAAANDGAAFSLGGATAGSGGASKGSGATNDLFASPAFAAGRVFAFNTLDAIVCEAHFDGSIVGVVKQLIRAARRQRFVAIPMTEAIIMARLAATSNTSAFGGPGSVTPHLISTMRDNYLSELATEIITTAKGGSGPTTAAAAAGSSGGSEDAGASARPRTYGQLFEALMRGWKLLPVGLYRRVHPATGLRVNPQTVAALQLAAGPPPLNGAFVHNRALVSYVYTNPPPGTLLSEHDLVYVLLPEMSVSADGVLNHGAGGSGAGLFGSGAGGMGAGGSDDHDGV